MQIVRDIKYTTNGKKVMWFQTRSRVVKKQPNTLTCIIFECGSAVGGFRIKILCLGLTRILAQPTINKQDHG